MKNRAVESINIKKLDDLFGIEKDELQDIPIEILYDFEEHPFNVNVDEEMDNLMESIEVNGVLTPGLCRKREEGGYEIISGHRRKYACVALGIKTMPMIVKELDDDDAVIYMVDSNLQRENIRISEKALAYGMKYRAIKNKGGNSLDELSVETGESQKTIQRLIYISRLIPELLRLVDDKIIGKTQAVDLSFLSNEEQGMLYKKLSDSGLKPISAKQASELKGYSQSGELNERIMDLVLQEENHKSSRKISISNTKLSEYFDDSFTAETIEQLIFKLLDRWKEEGN